MALVRMSEHSSMELFHSFCFYLCSRITAKPTRLPQQVLYPLSHQLVPFLLVLSLLLFMDCYLFEMILLCSHADLELIIPFPRLWSPEITTMGRHIGPSLF